jgi:hypothetical protein
MRALFLLLVVCLNSFAAGSLGSLIIGGRGGAALNDNSNFSFRGAGIDAPGVNYAVGPTVGVRLPLGFSVEGDALYNRQTLGLGQIAGISGFNTHADWWEFPAMVKFTVGRGPIAPVLGAGVSVRHINNFGSVPTFLLTGNTSANSVGFVAGGGLRCRLGAVSITPEVRYTRWDSGSITQSVVDAVTGGRNQAQILVGITF